MKKLTMTVNYVADRNNILLGYKKVRVGKGFWNGFGGRVKRRETILESAIREVKEESGLQAIKIDKYGIIIIKNDLLRYIFELHYFIVKEFIGEPIETDEMLPKWFCINEIPYKQMWPSDRFIIPHLLVNEKCIGYFHYSVDKKIKEKKIVIVDQVPDFFPLRTFWQRD